VTVQKLRKAGVSSREIIAITGHKTEESLKDYDDIDHDDHRRLSKILSRSNGANGMDVVASQSSIHNAQLVMMTKQTTMLSANPHPWAHMPFSVPCQSSGPVYNYISNCAVYMTPHGTTPAPQGKENQPQPPKRARIMDSDDEL
jgi:hypothetical protein